MHKFSVLVLVTFLCACSANENQMSTFKSETHNFEIDYIKDWDTTIVDPRKAFMVREAFQDSSDALQEEMNISVFPSQGLSLRQIVDENVRMARLFYSNVDIQEQKVKTESDIEGIQIELSYTGLHEIPMISYATFFLKDSTLYTLSQLTEPQYVGDYKEMFDEALQSFNWLN